MSIFRVRKDTRYFVASNEPFNDRRLTFEARGLMGYLLSKPDGWEVRMADIEGCSPAGRDRVRRIVKELCTNGYMYRIKIHTDAGQFRWITEVYESPSANPNPWQTTTVALEYRTDTEDDDPGDPPQDAPTGPGQAQGGTTDGFPVPGGLTIDGFPVSGEPVDILSTELVSTYERDKGADVYTKSGSGSKPPDPPEPPPGDDAVVFQKLAELLGGGLNPSVVRFVDTWLEKHPLKWVLAAIGEAVARGARSERYVDKVLIGWEANGYPKSREEQVRLAKKTTPSRAADQSKRAMSEDDRQRFREEQRQKNREQAEKIARKSTGVGSS